MKTKHIAILTAAIALVLSACSEKHAAGAHHGPRAAEAYSAQDYDSGYDMAMEMLSTCVDSVDMQLWLLDFHAKCSEMSEEKASDVRGGFRDGVEENSPETAERIF